MRNKLVMWILASILCVTAAACSAHGDSQGDESLLTYENTDEQQTAQPNQKEADAETEWPSGLPDFLKSGPGDMKVGSIAGIDPQKDKVVALTFDDGPKPSVTSEVLETLQTYKARATFFLLGNHVEQFPATTRLIYGSGNEIGNHSFGHKDFKTLTTAQILDEINQTNQAIYETVGARPILVRPPYGNITQKMAGEIGRPCILWSVDSEDWKYKNADRDYNHVMDSIKDGDIVLMHDIYKPTAEAVSRIVRELTKRGYKLVSVSQLIQVAQARGQKVDAIIRNIKKAGN